jgi:DNA-directed RNA polymerase specialized sigma24 family protein
MAGSPGAFMPGLAKARKQGRIAGRPRLVLNRAKIMQLDEEGLTIREIAAKMGVSPASVQRILKVNRPIGDLIPV